MIFGPPGHLHGSAYQPTTRTVPMQSFPPTEPRQGEPATGKLDVVELETAANAASPEAQELLSWVTAQARRVWCEVS